MLRPYVIIAFDGADDDGGTLYVIHEDTGSGLLPLLSAAWPQPLEAWAARAGVAVRHAVAPDAYLFAEHAD